MLEGLMKKPIVVFCALTCLAFGANSAQAQDAQTETLPTEDANTLADKAYRMVEVKGNSWKNLQDAIAIYESIENASAHTHRSLTCLPSTRR